MTIKCFCQVYIACDLQFLFTKHCGFKSLNTGKVTLSFLYFVLQRTGRRKRLNFLLPQKKKWSQIMSWHKNHKDNAVWYLSFLLNKIVNKRVSLSSIFLQCFVVKHWEMLAVTEDLHTALARTSVWVDFAGHPLQDMWVTLQCVSWRTEQLQFELLQTVEGLCTLDHWLGRAHMSAGGEHTVYIQPDRNIIPDGPYVLGEYEVIRLWNPPPDEELANGVAVKSGSTPVGGPV